jgi:hypothetical protein
VSIVLQTICFPQSQNRATIGQGQDRGFNQTQNLILKSMTLPHSPKLKIWF